MLTTIKFPVDIQKLEEQIITNIIKFYDIPWVNSALAINNDKRCNVAC